MAIQGYRGQVYGQTGSPTAFTNAAMADISGNQTEYQITDVGKRFWNRGAPVTVQYSTDGTTWTTVTPSRVQHLGGIVAFATALPSGASVRASGEYLPVAPWAGFRQWTLDMEADLLDVSEMDGSTFRRYLSGLKTASVSTEGFWVDDYFRSQLVNGGLSVIQLDTGAGSYAAYALTSTVGIETALDNAIGENRDFQISGEWVFLP